MLRWWEALLLGIIQGVSEFLPVSSTGHLQIGAALLGWHTTHHILLAIVLHVVTAMSIMVVYGRRIRALFQGLRTTQGRTMGLYLVLSAVPAGVVGIFFKTYIQAYYMGGLGMIGVALCINGVILLSTRFVRVDIGGLNWWRVGLVGLAQAVAIFPGISRSGSTISVALWAGVEKSVATEFSFLMALIPIIGSGLLEGYALSKAPAVAISWWAMGIGFVAAFGAGLWACRAMVAWVRGGKLHHFAWYCMLVGGFCWYYGYYVGG